LGELLNEDIRKISSRELSERMKLTASQIRQDLNCFGGFGQQGYGYNVADLRVEIAKIIGVEHKIKTIILGAGNLGRALAQSVDFSKNGCELIGVFDNDPTVIAKPAGRFTVMDSAGLQVFCAENQPRMAVLCIPKEAALDVAKQLIALDVRSFWNFSHCDLKLYFDNINVENVHLGDSLLTLAYKVNNNE
jgi:redox-sensing transcriptional repressor